VEADSTVQLKESSQTVDHADLVVGILPDLNQDVLRKVEDVILALPGSPRVVVLQSGNVTQSTQPTASPSEGAPRLSFVPWPTVGTDGGGSRAQTISAAYQSVFSISKRLAARGCCVVASQAEGETPRWINELARPLLEFGCDLVVSEYARGKFQGLINTSIISPLTRSLYGKRIQSPLGPDLGFSEKLYLKLLISDDKPKQDASPTRLLASATPTAICDNLKIRQIQLGARVFPPPDWTNTSSILAQTLAPVFAEMERRAVYWQRTRGSVSVPDVGQNISPAEEPAGIDVNHMIESFQLGLRDLPEIWGLVLPPATLLELQKLSRLPPEQFHLSDEVWARIIFDFSLAYRLRTINRDHLLRSMTPLYLAWVASFAVGVSTMDAPMVDQRLEKLALAYEAAKPYLVSRWRWPDRFNP
jgi:hypothetical protein